MESHVQTLQYTNALQNYLGKNLHDRTVLVKNNSTEECDKTNCIYRISLIRVLTHSKREKSKKPKFTMVEIGSNSQWRP